MPAVVAASRLIVDLQGHGYVLDVLAAQLQKWTGWTVGCWFARTCTINTTAVGG